jgi:hypothetical protein
LAPAGVLNAVSGPTLLSKLSDSFFSSLDKFRMLTVAVDIHEFISQAAQMNFQNVNTRCALLAGTKERLILI